MAEPERCPVCGAKAYVHKVSPDGCFMGWSVGCPRYFCGDKLHGVDNITAHEKLGYSLHGFATREGAVKTWNRRCKRVKKTEVSAV